MRSLIVALILVVAVALPAHGHTWRELNEWLEGWHRRLADALSHATGDTLSLHPYAGLEAVFAEYDDMRRRHPRWDGTFQASGENWAEVSSITVFGDRVERWRPLVAAYFPAGQVDRALCIIRYESGGNPDAHHSGSGASGLFQHLPKYWGERSRKAGWAGASVWDPEANVAVAAWLWRVAGWGHWTVRGRCA